MKKALQQLIKIPEGIEVKIEDSILIVNGPKGENRKMIKLNGLIFEIKNNEIKIGHSKATKNEKKRINTITSHINNMIKGVQEQFEYNMKICASHFPMNVSMKDDEILIKNFLGEKIARKAKIPKGAEVKIQGQEIIILSANKEIAGQAAANIERATKIIGRDRRIFQDGIYITSKGGKKI
jgi:large subunit ribosomal protein L6